MGKEPCELCGGTGLVVAFEPAPTTGEFVTFFDAPEGEPTEHVAVGVEPAAKFDSTGQTEPCPDCHPSLANVQAA